MAVYCPVETEANAPLVFITGASSGIGKALALHYAKAGWRLALVARRESVLTEWLEAENIPPNAWRVFPADVRQSDSIAKACEHCITELGLPDVVIANAGISIGVDTSEPGDMAVISDIFATNVLGMAATFQPFIRPMQTRGHGRLVAIASVAGVRGLAGHAAYCASKAAVISYCESLWTELRSSGVAVVTISPGWIKTPLTQANRYPMPFILSAEAFARKAYKTIQAGTRYRTIPWQMAILTKLLRALPAIALAQLQKGRARKSRLKRNG